MSWKCKLFKHKYEIVIKPKPRENGSKLLPVDFVDTCIRCGHVNEIISGQIADSEAEFKNNVKSGDPITIKLK